MAVGGDQPTSQIEFAAVAEKQASSSVIHHDFSFPLISAHSSECI